MFIWLFILSSAVLVLDILSDGLFSASPRTWVRRAWLVVATPGFAALWCIAWVLAWLSDFDMEEDNEDYPEPFLSNWLNIWSWDA